MSANPYDTRFTVVDLSTAATLITLLDCQLVGTYTNTVHSAAVCAMNNGAGTTLVSLPASLAAGTNLEFPDVEFIGGMAVGSGAEQSGSLTVFWRLR